MDVDGVRADMRSYRGSSWYEFRETVATLVALADLIRQNEPEQIEVEEAIVSVGSMLINDNS